MAQKSLPPADPEVLKLQRQAMEAQASGQNAQSILLLKQALSLQPQDPRIHFQLGDLYEQLGQQDQAKASYGWVNYLCPAHLPLHALVEKRLFRMDHGVRPAPPVPGGLALTLFEDQWAPFVLSSVDQSEARVTSDYKNAAFGEACLAVETLRRRTTEITLDFRRLLIEAPIEIRRAMLEASDKGALQFWLKADSPGASLEIQLGSGRPYILTSTPTAEIYQSPTKTPSLTPTPREAWRQAEIRILNPDLTPTATPDPYGGETEVSWWASSQQEVIADSRYQEVLIPLKDFGPWNKDWSRMVRYIHIRFPTALHGSKYYLDQIRFLPEYSEEKVKAMRQKRDAVVKVRAPQDPALWFFRDGILEKVVMKSVNTPTPTGGAPPGTGPLGGANVQLQQSQSQRTPETQNEIQDRRDRQFLASKGVGERDIAYKDGISYLVMDEATHIEGRRSLKADTDTHADVRVSFPAPETDLSPIRATGCLHLSIKGKLGGEIVQVFLSSNHEYEIPWTNSVDLKAYVKDVTTQWQHVSIPLADFGAMKGSGGGAFDWKRVNGCVFTIERTAAASNVIWLDSVWIGSCSNHPVPPEPDLPLIPTPSPAAPPKIDLAYRFVLPADLAFDSGKADLKPEALASFRGWADNLKKLDPLPSLNLVGHTDNQPLSTGSSFPDNQALSLARAKALSDYLVRDVGYKADLLTVSGEGESHPVADNGSGEGRAKNRRVEVQVVGHLLGSLEESARMGDDALTKGNFPEAWGIYSKIAGAAPLDPEIWYRLALTAQKAGQPEKAAEALRRMKMLLGRGGQ